MFRKPFKVKSSTQIRGSEKKKLKLDVIKQFPLLSSENVKEIFLPKENVTLVRIITSAGEEVQLYCINHLVVFFLRGRKIYPTVYLLWKMPLMLPYVTTHCDVYPVLQGGASLMIAGIAVEHGKFGIDSFGNFNIHDTVYVNLLDNKAAIAVGETAMSSREMFLSEGKGKGVIILHVYGDELQKYGAKLQIPNFSPVLSCYCQKELNLPNNELSGQNKTAINLQVPKNGVQTFVESDLLAMDLNSGSQSLTDEAPVKNANKKSFVPSDVEGNVLKMSNCQNANDLKKDSLANVSMNANIGGDDQAISKKIGKDETASMDDLLMYCFLKSLQSSVKTVKLPLLISTFYKLHMIPACPEGSELNVKKSSYKKISKFIEVMREMGIIKVDNVSNGVQCLITVNYNHNLLRDFDMHTTKEEDKAQNVQMVEKYVVNAKVLPIFSEFLLRKSDYLTPSDARKYIVEYIKKKKLNIENSGLVKLDETLKKVIEFKSVSEEPEFLKWDVVINDVIKKMSVSIVIDGANPNAPKVYKDKLPIIDISVVRKTGNKKVTTITNLDHFGINLDEFSHECQKGAAASAKVSSVPSTKCTQVQIQGNQVAFLEQILTEKYKIPKKYLRGLEAAPKKKK